jgi:hypothetical protein
VLGGGLFANEGAQCQNGFCECCADKLVLVFLQLSKRRHNFGYNSVCIKQFAELTDLAYCRYSDLAFGVTQELAQARQ